MNLREYARGKPCDVRAPYVCTRDDRETVLAHIKRAWCGSIKPPDICAVHACYACHDLIDGRRTFDGYTPEAIDSLLLRALVQRLADYAQKGVITW